MVQLLSKLSQPRCKTTLLASTSTARRTQRDNAHKMIRAARCHHQVMTPLAKVPFPNLSPPALLTFTPPMFSGKMFPRKPEATQIKIQPPTIASHHKAPPPSKGSLLPEGVLERGLHTLGEPSTPIAQRHRLVAKRKGLTTIKGRGLRSRAGAHSVRPWRLGAAVTYHPARRLKRV